MVYARNWDVKKKQKNKLRSHCSTLVLVGETGNAQTYDSFLLYVSLIWISDGLYSYLDFSRML